MITLYKKDNKGAMRFWAIDQDYDVLTMEYGQVGGEIQEQIEIVDPNAFRDSEEQAISKMNSKIKSKIKGGYSRSMSQAETRGNTNILGFQKPMKAILLKNVKSDIDYGRSFFQFKYNGHRCMIINIRGELQAYSSGGVRINTIKHILDHIAIPEGKTIDGELYCHGYSLQTISSWIKRFQPNSLKLKFHCYDVVDGAEYSERLAMMSDFTFGPNAEIVPTFKYEKSINQMLMESIHKGYEGIMIRLPEFGYEDGKRSKGIIKVKKYLDSEFKVINILSSQDGWARLRCITKDGKEFGVSAPGTMGFKRYVLLNKEQFIGKYVRVEFPEWTDEVKPSQPVALMFRDKGNE